MGRLGHHPSRMPSSTMLAETRIRFVRMAMSSFAHQAMAPLQLGMCALLAWIHLHPCRSAARSHPRLRASGRKMAPTVMRSLLQPRAPMILRHLKRQRRRRKRKQRPIPTLIPPNHLLGKRRKKRRKATRKRKQKRVDHRAPILLSQRSRRRIKAAVVRERAVIAKVATGIAKRVVIAEVATGIARIVTAVATEIRKTAARAVIGRDLGLGIGDAAATVIVTEEIKIEIEAAIRIATEKIVAVTGVTAAAIKKTKIEAVARIDETAVTRRKKIVAEAEVKEKTVAKAAIK